MSYPLLLTGTIDVTNTVGGMNRSLKVKDINVRYEQYIYAITQYIVDSVFDKIVFVENSNYKFNKDFLYQLAEQNNKQFEYLSFWGDAENVRKYGKSYGEAEAIQFGIDNSQLLVDEETIYKATGRIFIRNSKKICKSMNKVRNEFIRFLGENRCITYFFKFNKYDYNNHFFDISSKCDESKGIDIETVFYNAIVDSKIETKSFRYFPRITGIIGGLGVSYDKPLYKYIVFDILSRLGFLNVKE